MRVTGTWAGEYIYGADYGQLSGSSVPFAMSVHETWLLRQFQGVIRDDAKQGGLPWCAAIGGSRRRRHVTFAKHYPEHHFYDAALHRMVHTREHLGIPADVPLPPHRVHYAGELDTATAQLVGTWQCLDWSVPELGIHIPACGTGTWTARRVAERPSPI